MRCTAFHRIMAVALSVLLVFVFCFSRPRKAEAAGIVTTALGLAFASLVLYWGTSALSEGLPTGADIVGSWNKSMDDIREWIDSLGIEISAYAGSGMMGLAGVRITEKDWAAKVNEDGTGVNLTLEDVQDLKQALDEVYPEGLEIEGVRLGGSEVTAYTGYTNLGNQLLKPGHPDAVTADVAVYEYRMTIADEVNSDAVLMCRTYDNYKNYFSTTNFIPNNNFYVVCRYNSEAYNFCKSNVVWYQDVVSSLDGFKTSGGGVSGIQASNLVPKVYGGNHEYNIDLVSGRSFEVTEQWLRVPTIYNDNQGYIYVNGVHVLSFGYQSPAVDTIKIDETQYNAMIAAWSNAIAQGQATEADTIKLSIAQSTEAINAQLTGTITQGISATNQASQRIVDAINVAVAAAIAATAAGELDLSRLTLGQMVMTRFPFCIPFDLAKAFTQFKGAGTAAPVWQMNFEITGHQYGFTVDLTPYEKYAAIVRWGILVAFNLGLILLTRKLIKG